MGHEKRLSQAEINRRFRERRAEARLCYKCGKPLPDGYGKKCCPECRKELTERQKERYAALMAEGKCYRCGQPLPEGYGKPCCETCRKMMAEKEKQRYARLIAEGLCVYCTKPAREGMVLCAACAEKQKTHKRKKSEIASGEIPEG